MIEAMTVIKELQEMRDDGFLSDALLRKAVRKIKTSDDRYNWASHDWYVDNDSFSWTHSLYRIGA